MRIFKLDGFGLNYIFYMFKSTVGYSKLSGWKSNWRQGWRLQTAEWRSMKEYVGGMGLPGFL